MATNWQVGDRIRNRWEVHRILKGGMGVVYIIFDHEWSVPFAAKSFQDEVFLRNPIAAERFKQEALVWIKLDVHPNVTRARMLEEIEGKPFLFLEYVSGGDLSRWIGTPRLTNNLPQVLQFSIQFCDGMCHAISKGIKAHRDIKPQNCLVTESAVLKITDFGLAKVFDAATKLERGDSSSEQLHVGMSQTGTAAGTCTHMAPEQFEDSKYVDVRADIYSFGVTMFQMHVGELPFIGRNFKEYAAFHMGGTPPLNKVSNQKFRAIIERALSKKVKDRYQNFDDLRHDLAALYEAETGVPAPEAASGRKLNASEWSNKGNALMSLGHEAEALPCFDRSIELDTTLDLAWANKGMCLRKLNRLPEAIHCFDKALALQPSNAITWTNKGVALQKQSKGYKAVECYNQALRVNPRLAIAWFNKGAVLLTLNQDDEAMMCLRRAQELDPRDPDVWFQYGYALGKKNRHVEEIEQYDHVLRLNPNHEEALLYKGFATSIIGRHKDAMLCFDEVLRLNSRMAKAWTLKGRLLLALNNVREAIECLKRANQLGDSEAAAALAMLRQNQAETPKGTSN